MVLVRALLCDPTTNRRGWCEHECERHEDESFGEFLHGILWCWQEGNWSCDCNRSTFLYGDGYQEKPCGDTIELLELWVDGEKQDLEG